ncbi:hypothetical protein [Chroococcidiopsis sp.]|uniref:hypothetical protein n=1 Tax=Chroococcidiopsis sp. TaxID=3088168 RepID=UPI003F3AA09B
MKLSNAYSHVYSNGKPLDFDLWELLKDIPSLNGVYLAFPEYVEGSGIGSLSGDTDKVKVWSNLLADGNYLYSTSSREPSIIPVDPQFNNYPSIDFGNDGNNGLVFKFPIRVGTVIMVYLTREEGSYLLYSPRYLPGNPPVYYDSFPSGGRSLWGKEPLLNRSVYLAESRINGRRVSSDAIVPLNQPRLLTLRGIANAEQSEPLLGLGGRSGAIGGAASPSFGDSIQGRVVALLTFSESIPIEQLEPIEQQLGQTYINYSGPVKTQDPELRGFVGSSVSFNLAENIVDEWFDLVQYTLLSPPALGLSITNSGVLFGTLNAPFDGVVSVQVTNAASMQRTFEFKLISCRPDPIATLLPNLPTLKLVLSAERHVDGSFYGLRTDVDQRAVYWEDARRIISGQSTPRLNVSTPENYPIWIESDPVVNQRSSVIFGATSNLKASGGFSGKTFVWVYVQDGYGSRSMLDSFPDTKGFGELWTVRLPTEVHGQTEITKLRAKIHRRSVNTLNYKLPLGKLQIITATHSTGTLGFSGLMGMRGRLAFFACWDSVLDASQLDTVNALLAQRYLSSLQPYIFETNTEYRYDPEITIDLNQKVLDPQALPLQFTLLTPHYNSSIVNGVLSVTAPKDEVLNYQILVSNSLGLQVTLGFDLSVTIRLNPVYVKLKEEFGYFQAFYLPTADSTVLSGQIIQTWNDYRLNGNSATSTTVKLSSLPTLSNGRCAEYQLNGGSSLRFQSPITARTFCIAYIRASGSMGRIFLLGQDGAADFHAGQNGTLLDPVLASPAVLNADLFVNGETQPPSYELPESVLSIVIFNSQVPTTIHSIAQDRMFTDRSVKGYIPLFFAFNTSVEIELAKTINAHIRDYFDPSRFVLLMHFESGVIDSSVEQKVLSSNGITSTSQKKFGAASYRLAIAGVVYPITVPNETDLAYLYEEFTITFQISLVGDSLIESLILYKQADLVIYLIEDKLFVGRNAIPELALIATDSISLSGGFHHIELDRSSQNLLLFVDGVLVGSAEDVLEYRDATTAGTIGETKLLVTTTALYLDEFAIYRRSAFHTASFTPPTSPYN